MTSRLDITSHTISRYKQRVKDDPHRHKRTAGQISRGINDALDYVEDIASLPVCGEDYRIAEVRFRVRGSRTCPYFCILARDRLNIKKWRVITVLTQEMYERGLTTQEISV